LRKILGADILNYRKQQEIPIEIEQMQWKIPQMLKTTASLLLLLSTNLL